MCAERVNGESTYYDVERVFLRGMTVHDIAEPLPSFDARQTCQEISADMDSRGYAVVGIRVNGLISGYVERHALGEGSCGEVMQAFDPVIVLRENAPLVDAVRILAQAPMVFVTFLGQVAGIVTRADLQDPPVRMWLFGMLTIIEMSLLRLIEQKYRDDGWRHYLSEARLLKAQELLTERRRLNQYPRLLDCLQFSDKAQICVRDEELRQLAGFASRRRGDEVIKQLERLRNNLAHAQDIVTWDWETIVALAENTERLTHLFEAQRLKASGG